MTTGEQRSGGVQSVERALALMEALADRSAAGVTELADEVGVHKSTAHRLLATLEGRGMVLQDPESSKYRLGPGIARLAHTVSEEVDLRREARSALRDLAASTQETVNLAIRDGREVLNVDQFTEAATVLTADWLGWRSPLHCTASGKVIIAHMTGSRRRRLLDEKLEVLTPRTVSDLDVLERQLENVRAVGYATAVGELELGLNAVAAPIFDHKGEVVAAVSVSGPETRLSGERLRSLGAQVRDVGTAVSQRLGYKPASDAVS